MTHPDMPLVLRLESLPRDGLDLGGGKAVNLGEFLRAGLPVPPGFVRHHPRVRTCGRGRGPGPLLDELAGVAAGITPARRRSRRPSASGSWPRRSRPK